ncbi:MAG: hypothetical protein ABI321_17100 [Polyangia bacterium]
MRQDTGTLVLSSVPGTWRLRLDLVRGWIHGYAVERAVDEEPARRPSEHAQRQSKLVDEVAPRAPIAPPLARLAQLLVVAVRAGFVAQRSAPRRSSWDATTPFHPLAALRTTVARLLDPVDARALAQLGAVSARTISLVNGLHASALDPDEQAVVSLLSTTRSWDELLARSRATPVRLLRLLRDAAALGALRIDDADHGAALLHLMIHGEAEEAARHVKYRSEARALHPDLHPEADDEERARLTAAMADLATRNRR